MAKSMEFFGGIEYCGSVFERVKLNGESMKSVVAWGPDTAVLGALATCKNSRMWYPGTEIVTTSFGCKEVSAIRNIVTCTSCVPLEVPDQSL